ncbi:MAG: hypothetical protein LBM96_00485 [Methanobrevibacter sp.]|jgi:hypothetical protein|nr:hypothetical protein [Candidatus Methanoflexus mossambicus]
MMRGEGYYYPPLHYKTNMMHAPRPISSKELEELKTNAEEISPEKFAEMIKKTKERS